MTIEFEKQFLKPILKNTKKHTIRKDANNKYRVGMTIKLAERIKNKITWFCITKIISIQQIVITVTDEKTNIDIDGIRYATLKADKFYHPSNFNICRLNTLAENSGFNSIQDFFDYFITPDNDTYEGKIIHWDLIQY